MTKPIIKIENLCFNYYTKTGETKALKDINLEIFEGDFIAVVGPSGCGKTTLLSLISGLLKPQSGAITYYGKNGEEHKTAPKNFFGYMLQKDQLFDWRTVFKNITLPLEIQDLNTKENINYVNSLIEKYGLKEFKNKKPRELSGGMRQRVALIRTLALLPNVLLLDEPFSALDFQTRIEVCNDVSKIIKNEKKTAIFVTHDIEEAVSMSNKVVILSPRPATIKEVADTSFIKGETPLKRREGIKLSEWQEKIFKF